MAKRVHVPVGYATPSQEIAPGVWDETVSERPYYGTVIRQSRTLVSGESVNDDLTVGVSISVVADDVLGAHIFAIRYVKWAGEYWKVAEVTPEFPRLLLRLGGVYNGPKA